MVIDHRHGLHTGRANRGVGRFEAYSFERGAHTGPVRFDRWARTT